MNVLVAGGAGFIGSNFIRYLLDKYLDYRIINIDKLTYAGNKYNLNDFENNDRYIFNQIDITDYNTLLDLFKFWYGFDVIINFAAETSVDRSNTSNQSKNFINSNILGTYNFLEIIKKYKPKRYVQVSTTEVYGSIIEGKFLENSLIKPSNLYASSKASSDLIALSYFHTFNTPVIISRCCNNFGPFQHPEKFLPLMITNALENKKLPIYGTGENIRDWVHVYDHCRALDTLIHYGKIGEIYNIGGNNELRNIDLARYVLSYLDIDYRMIEMVRDRLGHDSRYAVNYSKMAQAGWKPMQDFKQSLIETIEWYKNNRDWWKNLKGDKK